MQNNFINNTISIILNRIKRPQSTEIKVEFSEFEEITLGEILTEEFISKFTNFSNFDKMIERSKLKNKYINYKNLFLSKQWNDFVIRATKFDGWVDFLKIAINCHVFQEESNMD